MDKFFKRLDELFDSNHTRSWCIIELNKEYPEVEYSKIERAVNNKFNHEGRA